MAWIQLEINQPQVVAAKCSEPQAVDSDVINQPQVVAAKCSEPQAVDSDVMGEGSGVAILSNVRTET